MKKLLLAALVALTPNTFMNAQEYFVRGRDTTYAREMEYTVNAQGFITDLSYVDKNGNKVNLEGKKKLKDIQSLHYYTGIVERMPLKISKPDGYVRYGGRVVNGKLKVLLYDDREETMNWVRNPVDDRLSKFQSTTSGTRLFYLRLPDGTLYNLAKKKELKGPVKSYLEKCEAFRKQYKGKYSMQQKDIIEMVKLYNSVCR